jgi:hypothetical protein
LYILVAPHQITFPSRFFHFDGKSIYYIASSIGNVCACILATMLLLLLSLIAQDEKEIAKNKKQVLRKLP